MICATGSNVIGKIFKDGVIEMAEVLIKLIYPAVSAAGYRYRLSASVE